MNQLLRNLRLLALGLGTAAMALRAWMLWEGTDERGLYPRYHPAWILTMLLCIGTVVVFYVLTRKHFPKEGCMAHFPASAAGAIGCLAATAGIAIGCIRNFQDKPVAALLGLICSIGLALCGWLRARGKKPPFPVYALAVLYLALYVFDLGRFLGAEPEISRYLPQLVGALAALMASYHLWGFSVDLANPRGSLCWSLSAVVGCMAAIPGSSDWPLFAGLALWLVTNLCAWEPLPPAPDEAPGSLQEPEEA